MLAFRTLSLALTAALGLVPLIPAEHVHETETNGHRQVVVHQHSSPHAIGHPPGDRDGRRAFDHPDDPVLTLSTVYTVPTAQLPAVRCLTVVAMIQPLVAEPDLALSGFVERLIHGPPHPRLSLRGPPHLSILI